MTLVALLLTSCVAVAGHWLPQASLELDADQTWALEQPGGSRRLLSVTPPEAHIEIWSGGSRVPIIAGPSNTLLIPSTPTRRVLEVTVSMEVDLSWWIESSQGESALWDGYLSTLAGWAEGGGEIPKAPEEVPALLLQWEARRSAMVANHELDPAFLLQAAALELDAHRASSSTSHARRQLEPGTLAPGETVVLPVRGPGRVELRTRAELQARSFRRYSVRAGIVREPLSTFDQFTTEDSENRPGWGWSRLTTITVPPGEQHIHIELTDDNSSSGVEYELTVAHRRPTLELARLTFPHMRAPGAKRLVRGPVGELETAHLTGFGDVVSLATALRGSSADELAIARLIEHLPEGPDALELFRTTRQTPLTAYTLAKRWLDRRDVDPSILIHSAALLPNDPALLAALADGLPWGFLRPRGRAIRTLAGLREPGTDDTRWTQLQPVYSSTVQRVDGSGGGVHRISLVDGESAEVDLPDPSRDGRFPVLRIEADTPTRYRVDGMLREGAGQLNEALSPGRHTVSVERGRVILMDAHLAKGGHSVRDKAVGPLPNLWVLPDPGSPGEVELMAWGRPGSIFLAMDDGVTREIRLEAGPNGVGTVTATVPVGTYARELVIEGDASSLVAVSMRRNNAESEVALPSPWPDPLSALSSASLAMLSTRSHQQLAGYRLERAAAFGALGLTNSSQREARAVAATPTASPQQRAIGKVIYRNSSPEVLTSEAPGPTTVDAALAMSGLVVDHTLTCTELVAHAKALSPPNSWPVHRAASECLLNQGSVVAAWSEATAAGALGRVAQLRVAAAGDWEPITRMDRNGGTVRVRLQRSGPDHTDGAYVLARELALGAPWDAREYSILRRRKQTTLQLMGSGDLDLDLLCRDEASKTEPAPCVVPISIDGEAQSLEIPEATIMRFQQSLPDGKHQIEVGPLAEPGSALVIRTHFDGLLIPPQTEFTAHLLGLSGAQVSVAGGSLVRVRVHRGGPLGVMAQGETHLVEDSMILALDTTTPVRIEIDGPPQAAFTLSRLSSCAWSEPPLPPLPPHLETNTPDAAASKATTLWMSEAAHRLPRPPDPIGKPGTFAAWGDSGDDATGIRDSVGHYPYLGAGAAWYQRLDGTNHWFRASAYGRLGIGGAPGAHLDGSWAWQPSAGLLTLRGSAGTSGGTGNMKLRARYRHPLSLGPWWTLQPYGGLHLAHYGSAPQSIVDPLAWNTWSSQHWAGYTLGNHLDWRPLRDGRVRLTTALDSNVDMTLDRARIELRTDAMILPMAVMRLGPELGYRFEDTHRQSGYWRLAMRAGLSYGAYTPQGARWTMSAWADWLMLEDVFEGGLRFTWEHSDRRGIRDHAPYDIVFAQSYDLPLERESAP